MDENDDYLHLDDETLKKLENSKLEISTQIVKEILKAIESDSTMIRFDLFVNYGFEISLRKEGYIPALEKNMEVLEEYEEYELCQLAQEGIKKLKNKSK